MRWSWTLCKSGRFYLWPWDPKDDQSVRTRVLTFYLKREPVIFYSCSDYANSIHSLWPRLVSLL
jgi:hypothetical protein